MDVRSLTKAVGLAASKAWWDSWPDSLFRRIMGDRFPKPVLTNEREDVVNVYQLRAGYWDLARSYLHRINRHPSRNCQQCGDLKCPAAVCEVCREEVDWTRRHTCCSDAPPGGHTLAFVRDYTSGSDTAKRSRTRDYLHHREPLNCHRP